MPQCLDVNENDILAISTVRTRAHGEMPLFASSPSLQTPWNVKYEHDLFYELTDGPYRIPISYKIRNHYQLGDTA